MFFSFFHPHLWTHVCKTYKGLVTLCNTNWINITNINHFRKVCVKCRAGTCKTCNVVKRYLKYHDCSWRLDAVTYLAIYVSFKNKKGAKSEVIASIQFFFFNFVCVTNMNLILCKLKKSQNMHLIFCMLQKFQSKKMSFFKATKHDLIF